MADDWGNEQQEPDYSFDSSEHTKDDLYGGGEMVAVEGWYHFEVSDVKPDLDLFKSNGEPKTPCVVFSLTVLESVEGQSPAGSRLFHRVYLAAAGGGAPAEGTIKSGLLFAVGLGLMEFRDVDGREVAFDLKSGKSRLDWKRYLDAKSSQIVAHVQWSKEEEGSKYKKKLEIPFGRCYQPDDPNVPPNVSLNADALALIGKSPANRKAGADKKTATNKPANKQADKSTAQQQPPQQQQTKKAPPPAADDDLSDF